MIKREFTITNPNPRIGEQRDFEFVHKDGHLLYTAMETAPIEDEDGNFDCAIAGVIDITERKKVTALLEKRNTDLELAQRIASIGTWTRDPEVGVLDQKRVA